MKKLVEEFALASDNDKTRECDDQISSSEQPDRMNAYALNYLKHFLLFEDLNDAVKEGDGPRLATLSKVLLLHFKAVHGFNSYAIEMITLHRTVCFCRSISLISVLAQQLPVGKGENQNCDQKNLVRSMGPNKTDKGIKRASRASGGNRKIVNNFDTISNVKPISGKHTHASSLKDEKVILKGHWQ